MESEKEMSRIEDGTPVKSRAGQIDEVDQSDYKAGYDKAKAENLAVLKNISEDLDQATESFKVARKDGLKWKKKMEEVIAREEELKSKAAERVKGLQEIVARSGVVGEDMSRLRGDNFSLQEVIWIGCGIVAAMMFMFFIAGGSGGSAVAA